MTSTKTTTTKTNHYFRVLVVLAVLASFLLMMTGASTAHADGEIIFKVNTTSDFADLNVGDDHCDSNLAVGDNCTLRAAIQESNATPERDIIHFNIPEDRLDPSSGVATISPNTELPIITEPVVIEGYSQPGASPNTLAVGNNAVLKVELDGSKATGGTTAVRGLRLHESSDSLILGLAINSFSGSGISISGDTSSGPTIANNNRIEGNFIGTDPSGTQDLGNGLGGVVIGDGSFKTIVGGTSPSARNVISGSATAGVHVIGGSAGNQVQGNYIGTDKSGKADLANLGSGVNISGASNNTIGGTTAGARNVISGNGSGGVDLIDSQNNKVLGNRIGTTASGTSALGNGLFGVAFFAGSSDNLVGDGTSAGSNTIAFNTQDGVKVSGSSTGNEVSRNSIFSNGALGIELEGGVEDTASNTANDAGDADTGPNGLQNKPVLTSVKTVSGLTTIKGKLNSHSNETYTIQLFSNPSGGDEGKKFLGQKTISTDGSGNRSFTFTPATKVAVGQTITATATRDSTGDTSEFSSPRTVASS